MLGGFDSSWEGALEEKCSYQVKQCTYPLALTHQNVSLLGSCEYGRRVGRAHTRRRGADTHRAEWVAFHSQ